DTGGVDLRVAWVGKECTPLVGTPSSRNVTPHSVGGEEKYIAISARAQQYGMGLVRLDRTRYHVARNDTPCVTVDGYQVQHFMPVIGFYGTFVDLAVQRRVCAKQQLLPGLATRIERAGNLCTTERTVVEQPTILTRKWNTLRHALVDNVYRYFRQAVYVGFARAVVTALYRIVEQPVNAVAVILVILCRVDSALGGYGVGPARTVLITKRFHIVAELSKRRRGRRTGQAGAHHNDGIFSLIGRVNQLQV